MKISCREKKQIFWALINDYPRYERTRQSIKTIPFGKNYTDIVNKEEKRAYVLLKKFADELNFRIPEYKNPE